MMQALKVKVEVDAETFYILCALSSKIGCTPEAFLQKLAAKYKQANLIQREALIRFLR